MGRRRELTGVANAVSSMFCSRSNDYHRAWLPGVLCHRLLTAERRSTSIDLLLLDCEDEISSVVAARTRRHIAHHSEQIGLSLAYVRTAVMRVAFDEREPNLSRADWLIPVPPLERDTWWFTTSVDIVDDLGRVRSSASREWCWPDPRELPIRGRSTYGPLGELIEL